MTATSAWYTDQRNWAGSHFEVGMRLGDRDDGRLLRSLRSVWTNPIINGPLPSPWGYWTPLNEEILDNDPIPHLYGTIQVGGRPVGCIVMGFRWASDWLSVAIPTGMLERVHRLQYPTHSAGNYWLYDVERDLAHLADTVYRTVPFESGVLGEDAIDVAGGGDGKAVTREILEEEGGYVLSERLWHELAVSQRAEILPSGLRWLPSKDFAGPLV